EVGAHGLRQEKESEMALPKLVGQDGRHAVLAFTSADALARWRADARPIQTGTLQVCRAAVHEEAAAVVVDVAGPVQFVIEGEVLSALAAVESGTVDGLTGVAGVTVARIEPARPRRRWFSRKGS
ncbi:MAG: SseB family protein, partial [Nonomuraea sp.]|nr:SseB family protein [Nonomuraea sp.]